MKKRKGKESNQQIPQNNENSLPCQESESKCAFAPLWIDFLLNIMNGHILAKKYSTKGSAHIDAMWVFLVKPKQMSTHPR